MDSASGDTRQIIHGLRGFAVEYYQECLAMKYESINCEDGVKTNEPLDEWKPPDQKSSHRTAL